MPRPYVDRAETMSASVPDRAEFRFPETVANALRFLGDHGFTSSHSEPTLVRFESDRLRIDVFHGRQSYEIGLTLGPVAGGESYSMNELLTLLNPLTGPTYRGFVASSPRLVARGVEVLAQHLHTFVASGLVDDTSLLQRLREQNRDLSDAYADEVRLADIRRRLETACRARDFETLVSLLNPVRQFLTDLALEKLKFSHIT